jgi:hypothetical protein
VLDRSCYLRCRRIDLPLDGWVVHPEREFRRLVLLQADRERGEAKVDQPRETVARIYADWPGTRRPGFRLVLPGPGVYALLGEDSDGGRELIGELELADTDKQRLFFMHIAKAGGSSVNAYFSRQFAPEEATRHLESDPAWSHDPRLLEQRFFLSGHVNSVAIDRHLKLDGFRRVTVLREPLEQLVSHLAWIRRLATRGEEERYEAHPPYVRAFADKLAATDFREPRALEALVDGLTREERGLVDNCQCRYLTDTVPVWVQEEHVPAAIKRLEWFDHVGFVDRLDDFLAEVARAMGWPLPVGGGRENVTREFFGLATPSADQRAALAPLTRFDEIVLAAARGRPPAG